MGGGGKRRQGNDWWGRRRTMGKIIKGRRRGMKWWLVKEAGEKAPRSELESLRWTALVDGKRLSSEEMMKEQEFQQFNSYEVDGKEEKTAGTRGHHRICSLACSPTGVLPLPFPLPSPLPLFLSPAPALSQVFLLECSSPDCWNSFHTLETSIFKVLLKCCLGCEILLVLSPILTSLLVIWPSSWVRLRYSSVCLMFFGLIALCCWKKNIN